MEKELNRILETMDVPQMRRDLSKDENLRWLRRNIGIKNKDHQHLPVFLHLLINFMGRRGIHD